MSVDTDGTGLLSIPEAVTRLRVGRSTVYALMGSGELETVKIGARRLVVAASLGRYVESLRAARRAS